MSRRDIVDYGCAVERPLHEGIRRRERRKAIAVGIAYAVAVLACYLLWG